MSEGATEPVAVAPSLAERQRELCARLAALPNLQQRLNWLVELARARPPLEEALRTERHRVTGCLARLWFVPEWREGACWFRADSDSLIVKAVAGLLCDFYCGQPPASILAHDPGFLAAYGIDQHLTPNRRNALARVWTEIQHFARSQLRETEVSAGAAGPAKPPPPTLPHVS